MKKIEPKHLSSYDLFVHDDLRDVPADAWIQIACVPDSDAPELTSSDNH